MGYVEPQPAHQGSGELNAAVARAVVYRWTRYVGRGPTKAYAFSRGSVLVVIMEDTLTRPEQALVDDGRIDAVLQWRRDLHEVMRSDLATTVEELTGARVVAALSDTSVDPDVAAEVFVLDRTRGVPADRPPGSSSRFER
jgi:uncharacterized protein YbcI